MSSYDHFWQDQQYRRNRDCDDDYYGSHHGHNCCCCRVGPPGPRGKQGVPGVKGDAGVDGVSTIIKGEYESLQDLIKAHPTGELGDGYLVNGYLYVWNMPGEWKRIGNLKGKDGLPGAQGGQGIQGERGIQGEQGIQGLRGEKGETGLKGLDGIAATIAVGETKTIPYGEPMSVVNTGDEHNAVLEFSISPGPIGDKGPIAATIPFSVSNNGYGAGVEIATDYEGTPVVIEFIGFGSSGTQSSWRLQAGEWNTGTITIDALSSYPSTFIMPYKGMLKNIYVVFANRSPMYLGTGTIMRPFICLVTSDCTSLSFKIVNETMTYTEPYVGADGEEIPKYSLRKGALKDLDIELDEGMLIGIVAGWIGEGVAVEQSVQVSVSGGIFVE